MNTVSPAKNAAGTLYVVSTPIGNLDDFSLRAVATLRQVKLIAAEDTRHSGRLLAHYAIDTPTCAYHDHSDAGAQQRILNRLLSGDSVALISDAGTPLIADPGFRLVRAVREAGVDVVAVPGACALVAALSVAGLPTDRFAFEGFLPPKAEQRKRVLESLVKEARTLVFYEAPHRLCATLEAMVDSFGGSRPAVLARELTKRFETIVDGDLASLLQRVTTDSDQQKGECVIVVEGFRVDADQDALELEADRVLRVLLSELSTRKAAALAARLTPVKKNQAYQLALKIQEEKDEN